MGEPADALVRLVADPDGVERGDPAGLALGQKPALHGDDQRLGNGMPATGPPDEKRVAVAQERGGLVRGDDPHRRWAPARRSRR